MTEIRLPPIKINKDGDQRKVGFELEYAGLTLEDTAKLVTSLFGGSIVAETRSSYRVEETKYGAFTVMLDMAMMQKLSAEVTEELKRDPGNDSMKSWAEKLLHPLVSTWMPNEIVTPPLPLDALDEMDKLANAMREAGAKGTHASSIYAFGMHINPELPDIPPARLGDYIAAFVLRAERLQMEAEMDVTRQLSRFAKLFPEDYAQFLLQPHYNPDFGTLVDDYLRFNPTRNRALDMLPAFCMFDEDRVRAAIKDGLVRKRPTFHYRLPNCDLDNPQWSPLDEWNRWLKVEELAEDRDRLDHMKRVYTA